ncbi:MAG: hypothetical protein ACI8UO_000822 [Verrucomicrobiales bacterium]|jgi:hypothetical protein
MKRILIFLSIALIFSGVSQAEPLVSNAISAKTAEQLKKMAPEDRIDYLVAANLEKQGLKPYGEIDNETFVRRVYVSIIGRVPTIEEAEAFHGMEYPNKREVLIQQLLESEGYVSNAYNFWADILRINSRLGTGATQAEYAYQIWLKSGLRENKPYDEMVRELVSARGNVWENGATGYYQRDRGMPLDNMSNTVRIFLGVRLECAQCHNHPFDTWTQMDYYKMAAFSYGMGSTGYANANRTAMGKVITERRTEAYKEAVGIKGFPVLRNETDIKRYVDRWKERKQLEPMLKKWDLSEKKFVATIKKGIAATAKINEDYQMMRSAENELYRAIRYISVAENKRGLKLPHDYQYTDAKPMEVVSASTMFGPDIDLENIEVDESVIDRYAGWLTARDNPTFTRVISNRLWKHVFGAGVFEPVDELTDNTKISNPELLAYLEGLMLELDFDLKEYLEILYKTETWQRAAHGEELVMGTAYHFQGPTLKRMSAEQIWDSIVGLALPEADGYRPRLKTQLTSIDKARLIWESLTELTPEEYADMVLEVGEKIAEILPKQAEIRAALVKARMEEKMDLYNVKRKELSTLTSELNRTVSEIGHKKLHEAVTGEDLLAALGMSEMSMAPGENGMAADKVVLTKLPKPEMPAPPEGLDRNQLKTWKARQASELKMYNALVAQMARASELESPARRGHFLREFGQSDREVIENAGYNASVPQALNLLNGSIVEALTNKFAVFGSRIDEAGTPEDKIRMIFQAMLTREPTEGEMELAKAEIEKSGEKGYEGLVWALLNTQQFLFVQ